jgi:hypothetical protein
MILKGKVSLRNVKNKKSDGFRLAKKGRADDGNLR